MTFLWITILIVTFCFMEFMAWFSHKYIMHGFLWSLHKDHHLKDHKSWFERNDLFFIFYALVSSGFVILWGEAGFWPGLPIAIGIFLYGLSYFIVHDIFIHQRFNSPILLFTTYLYISASKYFVISIISTRKVYGVHTRYITKTSIKKKENVSVCYGFQ